LKEYGNVKGRILIADDNARDLEYISGLLESAGHETITADCGKAAVEAAKRELPDVILLDVIMPDLNGYEVYEHLKEHPSTMHIPVVILTGLQGGEDKIRSLSLGAVDFLTKPLNRHELLARISSVLKIKHLHEELNRRNRELQEANDFKSRMIMFASHDLRNALSSIQGQSELILMRDLPREVILEFTADIRTAACVMKELLDNFMDLSKISANRVEIRKESFELQKLVAECVTLIQHRAKEQKVLATAGSHIVLADRARTRQVLNNLLSNAVKYSPSGGMVAIEMEKLPLSGKVKVMVKDQGPGVPEQYRDRIFDPFFRIPESAWLEVTGSGLGLSIARSLIEMMGGEIGVENNPDKGACFWFTLMSHRDRGEAGAGKHLRYLYCIARENLLEREHIGLHGRPLHCLVYRELHAFVSDLNASGPEDEAKNHLLAEKVTDILGRSRTLIPFKPGIVLRGDVAVISFLKRNYRVLLENLEKLEDRQEWRLDIQSIPEENEEEGEEIAAVAKVDAKLQEMGEGRRYLWGRLMEKTMRREHTWRLHDTMETLRRESEKWCKSSRWDVRLEPEPSIHAVFLVDISQAKVFKSAVLGLYDRYPHLHMELSGPSTPCSFIDMGALHIPEAARDDDDEDIPIITD
jgi:signal transduction histidine kinase